MRVLYFICCLSFVFPAWSVATGIPVSVPHDFDVVLDQDAESLISLTSQTVIPDGKGSLVLPISVLSNQASTLATVDGISVHIRGLLHEHASDLKVTLLHEDRAAVIVDKRGNDMSFGEPKVRPYSGLTQHRLDRGKVDLVKGTGFDYEIRDVAGENIAFGADANASSSIDGDNTAASRVVDGDVFYSGATTKPSLEPWIQIDLGSPQSIGTVMLWTPKPSLIVREVQIVETTGLISLAGSFQLNFNHQGVKAVTAPIAFDAVAMASDENGSDDDGIGSGESMQSKLEALENVGSVEVTRHGPNFQGGYKWLVTFTTENSNVEEMGVESNSLTAGPLRLPEDQISSVDITTSVNGTARAYSNIYMSSGYVLVSDVPFGEADLASARALAHTEREAVLSERQSSVAINGGVTGQYVRVQLKEGMYDHLSVSEIQVYATEIESIGSFQGGSPIPGRHYTSEQPLADKFKSTSLVGDWFLVLEDSVKRSVANEANSRRRKLVHGSGVISDWVLHLTDTDGTVTVHHMDLRATVARLPVFGTLYEAEPYSLGAMIETKVGQEIHTAPCYLGCAHKWGVGNILSGAGGSVAETNTLLSDRQVVYVPSTKYIGNDHFTYKLYSRNTLELGIGTVSLSIRKCRADDCSTELFGRLPTEDDSLRTPWKVLRAIQMSMEMPPDKYGQNRTFYSDAYCGANTLAGEEACNPGIAGPYPVPPDNLPGSTEEFPYD